MKRLLQEISLVQRGSGRATVERVAGHALGHRKAYHTSARRPQQAAAAAAETHGTPPNDFILPLDNKESKKPENPNGIRAQLRRWQALHGHEEPAAVDLGADPDTGEAMNNITRLPDNLSFRHTPEEEQEEREAMTAFMQSPGDEPAENSNARGKFLEMGDLVELEYPRSDKESMVAVFIQRLGTIAQFFTMQGRWVHAAEKTVQYSIPGWIDPSMVRPLLEHLPDLEDVEDMEGLMQDAYIKDLSVPREVSAPLVSRMVQFYAESQEIYRRHAGDLDNAHEVLAHEDRLRFTNLVSMAAKLLNIPASKVSVTALYAVRQAVTHSGFAFSIDRRSHRLTGHVTIRTKEQVRLIERVQKWLREWQDDLAATATMFESQLKKHKVSKGAQHVYSFLEKVKPIILESREDRQPTGYGSIGPSKVKLPITPESNCVRTITGQEFDEQDQDLIKFMETWGLNNMFLGLPRLEALPPLLLQATGLYEEYELSSRCGLQFLAELGVITPYENRVRFDQHLLLPQSDYSKPLQDLMVRVIKLQTAPGFVDSMAHLRHDWQDLPVYCIDDASAHEIDDGLSIEPVGENGKEWWVHIHIANPTAFFNRDHDLAKMSQHMHESVYMPERVYMMMPRWATKGHFSLGKDRPCLTFSARMDDEGNVLENKIRSGLIRNVFKLTPGEVAGLVGEKADHFPERVLTVGGEPPPPRERVSRVKDVMPQQVQQLKALGRLATRRQDMRKAAGGLFFDAHKPEVTVWESYKGSGLTWDRPHRHKSRRVEGDPVIQMRTKGLVNWFAPFNDAVDVLVREMMLLACEIAATWCSERKIPAVFRGSVPNPERMDSEQFFREVMAPAMKSSPDGQYPMHLGLRYLETFGSTALSTEPFKHKILGMDRYGKVTSPLRRYGDMIVHWQIEAALRQEAELGRSLVTDDKRADRSFLPFNLPTLRGLLKVIQPREAMIMKAKQYAEAYWMTMLLFRAFHFGEMKMPFETFRAYVHAKPNAVSQYRSTGVMLMELNMNASMLRPETRGTGLPEARQGDVWECKVEYIDVYIRTIYVSPLRLMERVE